MIEQLGRINLAEDLCPRKIALKAALMVEKSYKHELNLESNCSKRSHHYIQSALGISGQFTKPDVTKPLLVYISNPAGIIVRLEIIGTSLNLGITGTKNWFKSCLSLQKIYRLLRLQIYQVLRLHTDFLAWDDQLHKLTYSNSVNSITIAGHSLGGILADYLGLDLALNYRPDGFPLSLQIFTFGAPLTKEFFNENILEANNISLYRYAIANDLISELPAKLFNCDRQHLQLLPSVPLIRRPHRLKHFVHHLQTQRSKC
jgi:hypothetical protein